jgi:hypothetical protein
MNAGQQPDFADSADQMVHAAARELLSTGTLGDKTFKQVQSTTGLRCLADIVGVIGSSQIAFRTARCRPGRPGRGTETPGGGDVFGAIFLRLVRLGRISTGKETAERGVLSDGGHRRAGRDAAAWKKLIEDL